VRGRRLDDKESLFGLLLEEGDEVVAVLGLLETTECHLGTGDVLLGVLEVLKLGCISPYPNNWFATVVRSYQCVLIPHNALCLVGIGV